MSALSASFSKYKSELAETAARNAPHARPVSSAPPPSRTSTSTPKPAEKRTHEAAFPALTQPAAASGSAGTVGKELMTHVVNAVIYLKEKGSQPVPFDQLLSYLSLPVDLQKNIPLIRRALQANDRVEYIGKSASGNKSDAFKYRSLHPVTDGEQLIAYLRQQPTSQGLSVKELKDGWLECNPTIDRLEREGRLLVTRLPKDQTPKFVWSDSPALYPVIVHASTHAVGAGRVDADFVDFWAKTKLPASETEVRAELERAGITVTSTVKEVWKGDGRKKEKKRATRKGARTTNQHLLGVLKDYSGRKGG